MHRGYFILVKEKEWLFVPAKWALVRESRASLWVREHQRSREHLAKPLWVKYRTGKPRGREVTSRLGRRCCTEQLQMIVSLEIWMWSVKGWKREIKFTGKCLRELSEWRCLFFEWCVLYPLAAWDCQYASFSFLYHLYWTWSLQSTTLTQWEAQKHSCPLWLESQHLISPYLTSASPNPPAGFTGVLSFKNGMLRNLSAARS